MSDEIETLRLEVARLTAQLQQAQRRLDRMESARHDEHRKMRNRLYEQFRRDEASRRNLGIFERD